MSPSPATLRLCAEQLRTLAGTQEQNAQHCDDLLSGVLTLANPDTWTGPYPSAADAEFDRWKSGLSTSAHELRGEAARWRQTANHFDDLADAAPATGAAS